MHPALHPQPTHLQALREVGRVDIAFADYPYRANENRVCLLVNGSPATIDVDDPVLLEKSALEANPAYAGLLKAHPNATIFPGPRTGARSVVALDLSSGGQRFVVPFSVHDGCHACAVLGQVFIAFVFDVEGRLRVRAILRKLDTLIGLVSNRLTRRRGVGVSSGGGVSVARR
jgi:hypothetical protein